MTIKRGGRKSSAELTTPKHLDRQERPPAPPQLTPPEADVWTAHVNTQPAEWFQSEANKRLLVQLCRHSVHADRVAQLIDEVVARDFVDVDMIAKLMREQRGAAATIKALSTSLRLTPQSSYSARGAGGAKERRNSSRRPWEDG